MADRAGKSGLTAIADRDFHRRFTVARSVRFDLFDNFHSGSHLTEHHVFSIEPRSDDGGDEELRSVGVGAGIGHGQQARTVMLQLEVFVGELVAVNGLAAGAVVVGEIAALKHEVRDDAMKRRTLVAEAFFARAQRAEVFRRFGHDVGEEFKRDPARCLAVDVDFEEHCRISHGASH